MSTINVNNLSGKGGATPNLPDGAVISGVATVTNLKPTNVNVSGAVTATTFDGSLKSTGTPTLGLGVTINSSGVHISGVTTVGVVTGGTFYGDGSNLTGVGESIAPWYYNPPLYGEGNIDAGIGITFNKRIQAGSGTATLKIVSAGVAGTTIQSWGISSVTLPDATSFNASLVSNLQNDAVYEFAVPEGFIKDSNDKNYVGTAYTFDTSKEQSHLYSWGYNNFGQLGQNIRTTVSSPIQVPGNWTGSALVFDAYYSQQGTVVKSDGTLWVMGDNSKGQLGQNSEVRYSSPVQIPGTTWKVQQDHGSGGYAMSVVKTDGTLWSWGLNEYGHLGLNNRTDYSSPVQVGSDTTWSKVASGYYAVHGIKTDGTLWFWGYGNQGQSGLNSQTQYSSPTQVPGTTWSTISGSMANASTAALKTDGTLWMFGYNNHGGLGQNDRTNYSSPRQVPGTSWFDVKTNGYTTVATKTDGTLWTWGLNGYGTLGVNDQAQRSSPVQVPGSWEKARNKRDLTTYGANGAVVAIRTDGTLWSWGYNNNGQLGQNDTSHQSSPKQIGTLTTFTDVSRNSRNAFKTLLTDYTP